MTIAEELDRYHAIMEGKRSAARRARETPQLKLTALDFQFAERFNVDARDLVDFNDEQRCDARLAQAQRRAGAKKAEKGVPNRILHG